MRNVYAGDLGDRTISVTLQQRYHLPAEILVIEQQAAHIRSSFMLDIEEASRGRLSVRNDYRPENADFASRVSIWLPAYPNPLGRPVPQPVIRHERMVSQR
jgi:hypothetical protein